MEEIEFLEEWEASLFLKFLDDMLPTRFSWQSFKKHNFRVFWSAEKASIDHDFSIQDQIKTALSAFNSFSCFESKDLLIQFWAASMTEDGRRLLTTSDQPFAINYLPDEKLIQYKKDCPKYKFVGEGEEDHNPTDDGPVSRVFRTQLQELSPNLSYYSVKEYPERDLALGCGFQATFVLPVFEPTLRCCVGVLELLFTKYMDMSPGYIDSARTIVKKAGLDTVKPIQLRNHIQEVHLVLVEEELNGAMTQVRQTHGLPFVSFWARCERNSDACVVKCSTGEFPVISIPKMSNYETKNGSTFNFLYYYNFLLIRVSQGHVGKAFHADKPCLCRDVTRLSIIDYPLAHFERSLKFTGRFAVCLQSIATGFRAYVLEFFLPQDKSHSGDLHNFLSSILTTLKQHLKTFKVVTGDIGNDLFTEIGYLNEPNVDASIAKGKNAICAEEDNTSFTYYTISKSSGHETTNSSTEYTSLHTISKSSGHETTNSSTEYTSLHTISTSSGHETTNSSTDYETISSSGGCTSIKTVSVYAEGGMCTKAEDSERIIRRRSTESTMNTTRRKLNHYTGPSGNRSESVDSETGSSYCIKLFGRMMSVSQYQVPTMHECRGDSSQSNAPRSEGSAVVARTIPPRTTGYMEMVIVNENYDKKFGEFGENEALWNMLDRFLKEYENTVRAK